MYFKDMTQYEYYLRHKLPGVFNIGWIVSVTDFQKGPAPDGLAEKLRQLLAQKSDANYRVNQIRGVHPCNLCGERSFDDPFIGSCEMWIPAPEEGNIYAAPSLIIHYIEVHGYVPPQPFVDAVMQVNLKSGFNGQELYDELQDTGSGLAS